MSTQVEKLINWANAYVNKEKFPHANSKSDMWKAKDSCQGFVASAYYAAGINKVYTSYNTAAQARKAWGSNSLTWKNGKIDYSKIPTGACIYSQAGKDTRGHVSLYIGNGYIIEAGTDTIQKVLLNDTLSGRTYYSWGYNGNTKPGGSVTGGLTSIKQYLGEFTLTAYCSCKICCGNYSPEVTGKKSTTASGTTPKAGRTVAVDKSVIPLGSKLEILGKNYVAEDVGGAIKGNRIDIYFDKHSEAVKFGQQVADVYILKDDIDTPGSNSTISFNLNKKSLENLPKFNKAEKAKIVCDEGNKGVCLKIIHESTIYTVTDVCKDKITLYSKRGANPAKLTFSILRSALTNNSINFTEGDAVALMYDDVKMFWGYIFSKQRTKEQVITVVAYDQTRYLKNKETYCYDGKTATEVIKMIANDYRLQLGALADTEYVICNRVEDDKTLWDIIYNALDFTQIYSGKGFVFYDDFGSLTLKSYDDLRVPLALVDDDNTLIDFNYKTDIDTNTYNRVVMYRDNETTLCRDVYISQDSLNEIKWGVLQYTQRASDSYTENQIQDLCDRTLALYNRMKRTFSIEDAGNANVRAGVGVWVNIKDVGEEINAGFVVESCTHTFENGRFTMKLELGSDNYGTS